MSRAKARANRIRAEIPITEVLAAYGYYVHTDGGHREQQFSCDLHGDGNDSKPSARVYPESNSWYCFACAVSRDAIETVREKEGVEFHDACALLESRFKLPPLPWSDDGEDVERGLDAIFERSVETAEDAQRRVGSLLRAVTLERSMPLDRLLAFWEEYDRLALQVEAGLDGVRDEFLLLRDRVVSVMRGVQVA